MNTVTEDPILNGAAESWECDGVPCAIRDDGPVPTGHVKIPENLLGQWDSYHEAAVALGTARSGMRCEVVGGPVPGVVQTGTFAWLTINAYNAQAEAVSRDEPMVLDKVKTLLLADAERLARRVLGASRYLAEQPGRSVKPARPTYPHTKVRELMVSWGKDCTRAEVILRPGETSWNPARPYAPFVGKPEWGSVVRYEVTRAGITATEID